ncbi:MAG: GlxA family transcriptional regulator [Acetobacteraceae bacterium]|nr:GlxA family transcriptional regulator [Acetobacteraceae bacterium]
MPPSDKPLPGNDTPPHPGALAEPRRIGFLLIPDFALMAYASAIEPYRAANTLAGRTLYTWQHVSPDGKPVLASNGVAVVPDQGIEKPLAVDDLFVCAGGNPAAFEHPATFAWLRAQAKRGGRIGGVSGGPFLLAKAGLLTGRRCTAHWEHVPAIAEAFPKLNLTGSLFEVDRDRCTCSGGTAPLDMMVALIRERHGRALAHAVSEWFLHTEVRAPSAPQRMSLQARYGVTHRALLAALEAMQAALEEPLPREVLAARGGVSVRQLERLFRAHLCTSVGAHYLGLRLDRARQLLRQTGMSVLEVGTACGFVSAAHFSRAYRARYGVPPRSERSPEDKSMALTDNSRPPRPR